MIRSLGWGIVALFAVGCFGGCARHRTAAAEETSPMTPAPVSAMAREQIQKAFVGATIGTVVAVLPDEHLAAIADVQVQDFRKGDVLTFFGGEEVPLATGEVVAIEKDQLHVRYVAIQGQRPVARGDLAVRFRQ